MGLMAHDAVHLDGALRQRADGLRFPGAHRGLRPAGTDRLLGMHFFTNELGGNMMNYPNLFLDLGPS